MPDLLPPSSVALAPRDRAFSAESSAIDKDARTAAIVFATEFPALRFDWDIGEYFEVLDCTPGAADLSRLNNGGAFLREHNRDQQIGVHLSAQMSAGERKGRAVVKFSRSPLAEQEFQDIQDGIRSKISVSYQPLEMQLEKTSSEGPSTYRVTKWQALENSLVSVPLDPSCQVGRSEPEPADPNAPKSACKITIPDNLRSAHEQNMKIRSRSLTFHEADKGSPSGGTGNAPAAPAMTPEDRAKIVNEGIAAEQKRRNDIEDYVTFFRKGGTDIRETADQYIKEGKSAEDLRKHIADTAFVPKPIDFNTSREQVTIVREAGRPSGLSVGQEFVRSKQFVEVAKQIGRQRSASLEFRDCVMLGARGTASLAARQRAGFTSGDLSAVNIQVLPGMVELGLQKLTVMDLLTGGSTGAAAIIYPKENGFGTVNGVAVAAGAYPRAQMVGERGLKPDWDPDLTSDTANVKKVAITTKVPDEFMADFPSAQSYIDGRLPYMVDLETEFQLLYGDGLGNNLKGIFTTAGIQQRAIDATSDTTVATSLKKGLTDVSVGSQFEPTGYAFHPYDWETASLLKDGAGRFLAGGPFYIPYGSGVFVEMYTFWGKPVVVSTSVTYGKPVTGSWKLGAQYFICEGMRIEMTNSNEDDFRRNLIALRAEHRLALATYRPVAFLEFTGFPARF